MLVKIVMWAGCDITKDKKPSMHTSERDSVSVY